MYNKLDVSKEIRSVLEEPIPGELIQERRQGGTTLSYISGSTVIDYLNRAFGYMWDWKVDKFWIQKSQPKFNPKYDKEPQPQAPIAHVLGTITVYLKNDDGKLFSIRKQGFGSKVIIGGASEQDSIFKAAGTDALKKAASLLGVGAQLYRSDNEQAYFEEMTYEDPWTDEELQKHAEERRYLKNAMKENNFTEEDINSAVESWSDGAQHSIDDILPDDFSDFVAFVKDNLEATA